MKKFVIVQHQCKEFANRLWNDMAIHAYALQVGAVVVNHTFFEHTFLKPFHSLYARIAARFARGGKSVWALGVFRNLPPSEPLSSPKNTISFFGWKFRNPVGFTTYRSELLTTFGPKKAEKEKINTLLTLLGSRTRIGITLKQKPFPNFKDGGFLVSPTRVREILDEYLKEKGLSKEQTVLVVVSDLPLPQDVFEEFSVCEVHKNDRVNLFALASCSVVIGTNNTFPNLAAWFGNIPHIVQTNEPIDWTYYRGKDFYFENKYATFAFGLTPELSRGTMSPTTPSRV